METTSPRENLLKPLLEQAEAAYTEAQNFILRDELEHIRLAALAKDNESVLRLVSDLQDNREYAKNCRHDLFMATTLEKLWSNGGYDDPGVLGVVIATLTYLSEESEAPNVQNVARRLLKLITK